MDTRTEQAFAYLEKNEHSMIELLKKIHLRVREGMLKHMYSRSLSASTYDKKRRLRGRIRRKRSRFFCLGTWIRFMPSEPLAQNHFL